MKYILLCIITLLTITTTYSRTWHVNASISTSPQNGYYWKTALKSFKQAIDSSAAGDTIKVAEGIYNPGSTPTSTFNIKNKVVILGGYSAIDSSIARNFSEYKTILSGKYNSTSKVSTVVRIAACDATTKLDGFIIEDGYEYLNEDGGGGARIILSSEIRITNCVFRNNSSASHGGTIAVLQNSKPVFTNCYFQNNQSFFSGAIFLNRSNGAKFFNCVFVDNQGRQTGTVFRAIESSVSIINCTIFRNRIIVYDGSAGMDTTAMIYAQSNSTVSIHNTILFSNTYTSVNPSELGYSYETPDVFSTNSSIIFSNSISQNQAVGSNLLISANPRFKDTTNIIGLDNRYFTTDDGLSLTAPCSQALNSGDNSYLSGILTDITGNPRIYNAGTVDMGAYEYQSNQGSGIKTVYVNKLATGSNNGSSWSNAYTDLQTALWSCADTIKIAAGDYFPSASNPYCSFWLRNNVTILGGYPSSGNPTDAQRNPSINLTKLNGQLPNSGGIRSKRILYAKNIDSTCIVDGVQIVNAKTNYYETETGALRITNKSNPIFNNVIILGNGNEAGYPGAGATIDKNSYPVFKNSTYTGNIGGTIYIRNKSNATFIKCNFLSNGSPAGRQAVIADSAQLLFDSCLFKGNSTGAIYLFAAKNTEINNSTFIGNYSGYGNSVYQEFGNVKYYNTSFKDTIENIRGGSVYATQTVALFDRCLFGFSRSEAGGAIYSFKSTINCVNTVFNQNWGRYGGGAIYNTDSAESKFINTAFTGNSSYIFGSCIYNRRSNSEIINSTAVSNIALRYTSQDTSCVIYNVDSSFAQIRNSIFWGNEPGMRETISRYFNDIVNRTGATRPSGTILNNSTTQIYGVNGLNNNFVNISPRLFNYSDADGADNLFFTADDGIALSPCSPMINAGNNSFINSTGSDIISNNRITNSVVDIGAYEYTGSLNTTAVFYVNSLATGLNNGTSWQNAYTNLHAALKNFCADTIKVAAGTYKTAFTSRDSFFTVKFGTVILGGYPNSGNPTDNMRSPQLHPTILDGNAGNTNDSTDNSYHVVSFYSTEGPAVIDGFIIKRGHAFGSPTNVTNQGGGVLVLSSDVTIRNCIIEKNAAQGGGGLSISGSKFRIDKTILQSNYSIFSGGGIDLFNSTGTISNSVLSLNYSETSGGGLYTNTPSMKIVNVVFNRNKTKYGGGGAYNNYPVDISYINCTFFRNHTTSSDNYGGGIYVTQSNTSNKATLYNCIFSENRWGFIGNPALLWSDGYYTVSSPNQQFTNMIYNTAVQTIGNTNNQIGGEIKFADSSNATGTDGIFMTSDDGLRLLSCSAGIDVGLNATAAGVPADIVGANRIQNNVIDLGAYEHSGIDDCLVTSINDSELKSSFVIFPNPTKGLLLVKNNSQVIKSIQAELYDLSGRLIISFGKIHFSNQNNHQFDLSSLHNGFYILKLSSGKAISEFKISLIK